MAVRPVSGLGELNLGVKRALLSGVWTAPTFARHRCFPSSLSRDPEKSLLPHLPFPVPLLLFPLFSQLVVFLFVLGSPQVHSLHRFASAGLLAPRFLVGRLSGHLEGVRALPDVWATPGLSRAASGSRRVWQGPCSPTVSAPGDRGCSWLLVTAPSLPLRAQGRKQLPAIRSLRVPSSLQLFLGPLTRPAPYRVPSLNSLQFKPLECPSASHGDADQGSLHPCHSSGVSPRMVTKDTKRTPWPISLATCAQVNSFS